MIALWIFLGIFGLQIAIWVVMFFVIIATSLTEKLVVNPYGVPPPGSEYAPSKEANWTVDVLSRFGFTYIGCRHDNKGQQYAVRYDFWISADHATLALVGSGKVFKINVNSTTFTSVRSDGKILTTTDYPGTQLVTKMDELEIHEDTPTASLWQKHEARLMTIRAVPFSSNVIEEFVALRKRRVDDMIGRGYVYYMDAEENTWRYTLKGALITYFITVVKRPMEKGWCSLKQEPHLVK